MQLTKGKTNEIKKIWYHQSIRLISRITLTKVPKLKFLLKRSEKCPNEQESKDQETKHKRQNLQKVKSTMT